MTARKRASKQGKPARLKGHGARRLFAIRPLELLSSGGRTRLDAVRIAPERVGWKAFGISALPEAWTLPFLVIDDTFVASLPAPRADEIVSEALMAVGIQPDA